MAPVTTREGRSIVRRLTAALAALTTALGLVLVAGPVGASITSPANGAIVAGNITVTDSGAANTGNFYCSDDNLFTRVNLVNSSNQVVAQLINLSGSSAKGSKSATLVTRDHPNGSYTLTSSVRNVVKSGFGGLGCGTSTSNTSRTITIRNTVSLEFAGALTAPANTSVPVTVSVADANVSGVSVASAPVTVSLAGGGTVSGTTNGAGQVTLNLPVAGPPRTATLTVTMGGTSFYQTNSITRSFVVEKNSTSTTLAQPAPVVHGQETSFSATVVSTNGLSVAPSGTVQFTVDGIAFGVPVALVGGVANSAPTSSLTTADHTVGSVYSGSSDHLGSTATPKTQVVNKAGTVTGLSASPSSPTVSGQAVTFTAHVDVVAPGVGTLGGGVQFNVDGNPFGTAVPLGAGDNASVTISNLSTGNHDVVAVYNGNADFAASSSATLSHGVDKADSAVALSTSDSSAVAGQPLTFTADVTAVAPGSGTPTGLVQFAVDGVDLGAPVALAGGVATSPIANLDAGSHTITANYEGDGNFGGQSATISQAVAAAQTTTVVSSSPNPSVFGQDVTVTAEVAPVAPATGTPEGVVQFYVDGDPAGAFAILDEGVATTTLTGLSRGDHQITAVYASTDPNFVTSTSAELTQVVNKASTEVALTSSSPTSVFGQPVTFTASVSVLAPGAGSPAGTIEFRDGTTVIGTEPVSSSTGGQASLTVSDLTVAQHAITASYSGDDSFNGSAGSTIQRVTRALTSTSVASSANPAQTGQGVQFTATVTPVAPGAGNPSGTVRFTINGAPLGGANPIVDGVATSPNFSSLTPGKYTVSASYSGDGNFVASTGVLDQGTGQDIVQGLSAISVVGTPEQAEFGEAVTFTSTVTAVAPSSGKPTGVVRIWEGDVLLGATSLVPQSAANTSQATFVTSSLSPGSHAIRAEYVGNFNFAPATATTNQSVGQIATVTGIASSSNPSTFGDAVTFTATVATNPAGAGTPTGAVTFTDGSTVLGTASLATVQGQQQASITLSSLSSGVHAVTATYAGTAALAGSASPELLQQVDRAASTLHAEVIYPQVGPPDNAGLVRATLRGNGGAPLAGETLVFTTTQPTDGSVIFICSTTTDAAGFASCDATSELAAINLNGGYDVTFAGNQDYLGATDHGTHFNATE